MPYCPNCYGPLDNNARSCNRCKNPIRGKKLDKMPKSLSAYYKAICGLIFSLLAFPFNFVIANHLKKVFPENGSASIVIQNGHSTGLAMFLTVFLICVALCGIILGVISSQTGHHQIKHNATNHEKCNYYSQLSILIGIIAIIVAVITIILQVKALNVSWSTIINYYKVV